MDAQADQLALTTGEPTVQPATNDTPEVSARRLLVDWANKQDHWVRRLAAEILSTGAAPGDCAIADAVDALFAEKHLSEGAATPVPPLVLEATEETATQALVISKLSHVGGVNALAPRQAIPFNPGLTVLFGENAAGKTGYARVLKRLAAVRTAEAILPNVHDPAAAPNQTARISYRVGDDEQPPLDWQGEAGIAPFTRMAIFDSPCVRMHVDEDLAYNYTPSDLALFLRVTEAIGQAREKLVAAASRRRPAGNTLLPRFTRGTAAYALIETLGSASDLDKIRALAQVPRDATATLTALESKVLALQGDAAAAQLAVARTRRDLHHRLTTVAATVVAFDSVAYNTAVRTAAEASHDYEALRANLINGDGEAAEPWQRFVQEGDRLREQLDHHEYPQPGDACLYCKQPLDEEAVALLQRYRDFANAEARKRADSARELAGTIARSVSPIDVPALRVAVAAQAESDTTDPALVAATTLLDLIEPQCAAASEKAVVTWSDIGDAAGVVAEASAARRDAAASLVADLTTKAGERAEALAEAVAERDALKDRIELQRLLPTIETHVKDARWAAQATQLERRFPALLRSLTETSKEASEQLLNVDFEQRFRAECKALRAPSVKLDFPGRQGQTARRKTVAATGRPSDVLSEGEQKVIALADFLAEAGLRLSPSPVIFDDPVTSLDHRRVREVAARIAALAGERQVIVFTHNIWLATELLSHFESDTARCTYFGISDDGAKAKGIVTPGTHPRWDTVNKTRGRINTLIQSAEAAEGETRNALVENAYSVIRAWCEVLVEKELLAGVTQRYQANVMMTALPSIKGAHLGAAVEAIIPVFEKACRVMEGHSQPLDTLGVRPSLSELKEDWAALQNARQEYQDAR
ncbi:MAG: AAA family ATPase [Solirubrobacteraceae bacterium]